MGYNADGAFDFRTEPVFQPHHSKDATDIAHQLKNFYNVGNETGAPRVRSIRLSDFRRGRQNEHQ